MRSEVKFQLTDVKVMGVKVIKMSFLLGTWNLVKRFLIDQVWHCALTDVLGWEYAPVDALSQKKKPNFEIKSSLTFNILISLPRRFCDLARFFLAIALMATVSLGLWKKWEKEDKLSKAVESKYKHTPCQYYCLFTRYVFVINGSHEYVLIFEIPRKLIEIVFTLLLLIVFSR